VQELPQDIREIIQKVKEGKLHIEFEHKGLTPSADSLSQSINRLSFSLLVVAIILGSSLIVVAKVPPLIYHIPLVGIIGYGISAVLTLGLLIKLKRSSN
jgi:ubiquinone biosynthesis protein